MRFRIRPQADFVGVADHPQAAGCGAAGSLSQVPRSATKACWRYFSILIGIGIFPFIAGVNNNDVPHGLLHGVGATLRLVDDTNSTVMVTSVNSQLDQVVHGALHTTPRRIRPRQPPPPSGLAGGVHLPAGAGGATASAPPVGGRRDNIDTRRLGPRQPRRRRRLTAP